jgi:hypothetical protein
VKVESEALQARRDTLAEVHFAWNERDCKAFGDWLRGQMNGRGDVEPAPAAQPGKAELPRVGGLPGYPNASEIKAQQEYPRG